MGRFSELRGFRILSPAERELLDASARQRAVQRGDRLFEEGDDADAVWGVKEGVVHILKSGPEGREMVLEVVPAGELFGAIAAIENRRYPAGAQAAEDGAVWVLAASVARDLCRRYPSVRAAILEQVTARLRNAHERLRSVALERVEQRLARMVLALADKIGQARGGQVTLAVTRQELADMIGTTVESAIRVTSRWQSRGLVSSSRNELVLADLSALREIAAGGV
jgi:CRP/FNR family transcriptional regulator